MLIKIVHFYSTKQPAPFDIPDSSQNATIGMRTDSEQFHQSALINIIEQMNENNLTLTMNESSFQLDEQNQSNLVGQHKNAFEQTVNNINYNNNRKKAVNKKFNLNQFIQNAVYPAECPSDDDTNQLSGILLNASHAVNHLSGTTTRSSQHIVDLDDTCVSQSLDDTIVDEELILNLSQKYPANAISPLNVSLTAKDWELLEILRQLEEQEDNDESHTIEEDSALAPLSQSRVQQKLSQRSSRSQSDAVHATNEYSAKCKELDSDPFDIVIDAEDDGNEMTMTNNLNKTIVMDEDNQSADSDDDLLNEFSMTFDFLQNE